MCIGICTKCEFSKKSETIGLEEYYFCSKRANTNSEIDFICNFIEKNNKSVDEFNDIDLDYLILKSNVFHQDLIDHHLQNSPFMFRMSNFLNDLLCFEPKIDLCVTRIDTKYAIEYKSNDETIDSLMFELLDKHFYKWGYYNISLNNGDKK